MIFFDIVCIIISFLITWSWSLFIDPLLSTNTDEIISPNIRMTFKNIEIPQKRTKQTQKSWKSEKGGILQKIAGYIFFAWHYSKSMIFRAYSSTHTVHLRKVIRT